MSEQEPETLIEQNGYIYKLMLSKEETRQREKEAEEKLERNFKAFVAKIGTEQYNFLYKNKAVLEVRHGGNYPTQTFYDFYNNLTWWTDEYTDSPKKHFGDTDWYSYDGELTRQFASDEVHKAIADYYFELLGGAK